MRRLINLLVLLAGSCVGTLQPVAAQTTEKVMLVTGVCIIVDETMPNELGAGVLKDPVPCRTIILSKKVADAPPAVLLFVLFHEQMHIYLEHQPTTDVALSVLQETAADCNAAMLFKQKWPLMVPELLEQLPEYFYPSLTWPDVKQRLAKIKECLNSM
jgi:hypothetical protein